MKYLKKSAGYIVLIFFWTLLDVPGRFGPEYNLPGSEQSA